ncbi:hypothetical protein AgCh_020792 [Apium graveolens]
MASSSSDPKSEKSKTTESSQQPEQLPPGYPFPPPLEYQQQQPYQAYPGNHYQYAAQQQQQPPPGYYPSNPSYVLFGPPQRSLAYKLARVILVTMIVLFLGMSVMSFLAWLIYGSDIPIFHAESLEMTVFDMNNMALNATWSANVNVRNPSHKYEVTYDYVEATLVYDDHLLDTNYVNPFLLAKKEKKSFSSGFQTPNANQKNIAGAAWVKDMEEERRDKESITFDMRIVVNVEFKDHDRSLSRTLKVLCGDLIVEFPSAGDTVGNFHDGDKECLILST